jgi:hypothetical protein
LSEAGHIERIVAGETPQSREIDKIPEQAADQVVVEPVMTRVDRSMGREHTPLPHRLQVIGKRAFGARSRLRVTAQESQREQRRIALIEVVGGDFETERPKEHFPADAEHDFLLEAQLCVSAVKPVGDAAVVRLVLGDISVQ